VNEFDVVEAEGDGRQLRPNRPPRSSRRPNWIIGTRSSLSWCATAINHAF